MRVIGGVKSGGGERAEVWIAGEPRPPAGAEPRGFPGRRRQGGAWECRRLGRFVRCKLGGGGGRGGVLLSLPTVDELGS